MLRKLVKIPSVTLIVSLIFYSSLALAENKSQASEVAYVDVAVATLWTAPNILREVDLPSSRNPVKMWKWKEDMDYKQQIQLSGDGMLETQALYGNKVRVLREEGDWVKVAVEGQPTPKEALGYSGWMPERQLAFSENFDESMGGSIVLITSPTAFIYETSLLHDQEVELSYNTRLPYLDETSDAYQVVKPDGGKAWVDKRESAHYKSQETIPVPTGKELVDTAKKFLNLHYLWAGMSGFGFDCSGFTFTLYQSHGITIPRDAGIQAIHGKPVELSDIQPGDLLFFSHDNGSGSVHHVAMYAGKDMMIHSPNSKKDVEIIPIRTKGYFEEISGVRRYLVD